MMMLMHWYWLILMLTLTLWHRHRYDMIYGSRPGYWTLILTLILWLDTDWLTAPDALMTDDSICAHHSCHAMAQGNAEGLQLQTLWCQSLISQSYNYNQFWLSIYYQTMCSKGFWSNSVNDPTTLTVTNIWIEPEITWHDHMINDWDWWLIDYWWFIVVTCPCSLDYCTCTVLVCQVHYGPVWWGQCLGLWMWAIDNWWQWTNLSFVT